LISLKTENVDSGKEARKVCTFATSLLPGKRIALRVGDERALDPLNEMKQ